eukprot:1746464-Prymnesium_polylepis.1
MVRPARRSHEPDAARCSRRHGSRHKALGHNSGCSAAERAPSCSPSNKTKEPARLGGQMSF